MFWPVCEKLLYYPIIMYNIPANNCCNTILINIPERRAHCRHVVVVAFLPGAVHGVVCRAPLVTYCISPVLS